MSKEISVQEWRGGRLCMLLDEVIPEWSLNGGDGRGHHLGNGKACGRGVENS